MQHIPYILFAAIPAFCWGFVAGGYVYRRVSVARRWRRSRRVPAREIVDAMNEHDALKQRLKDAIDIADAFHKELQHVLDCLCYAQHKEATDAQA